MASTAALRAAPTAASAAARSQGAPASSAAWQAARASSAETAQPSAAAAMACWQGAAAPKAPQAANDDCPLWAAARPPVSSSANARATPHTGLLQTANRIRAGR